jgi:hypothetical protein
VYGGLEYTEGGATTLLSYPGSGAAGAAVAPNETARIDQTDLGFFRVADADLQGLAGDARGEDYQVLQDNRVRLTNDTVTAEWVIDGHAQDGLTVEAMMKNIKQDIAKLIGLRQQLKHAIAVLLDGHAGDHVLLAAGTNDLRAPGPQGLFEYAPAEKVFGGVQITVQYENLATITRIARLNASKYLPGTKVALGDDAAMVADALSLSQKAKYAVGQSSFASAQTLLEGLTAIAQPIVATMKLTKDQVGLVMLMVINDAMASTMRRHASAIGQTDDKNVQRFFAKSRRNLYVNAVAEAAVPNGTFTALRQELARATPAMLKLQWESCDPFVLDLQQAVQEFLAGGGDPEVAASWGAIQKRGRDGEAVSASDKLKLKHAALGVDGALLRTWIGRAALAYTDTTAQGTDQYQANGNGNVILSMRFTPVAGTGHGAVYEFREREVVMAMGQTDGVIATMTTLFNAAVAT